jgi:hypothetical protein
MEQRDLSADFGVAPDIESREGEHFDFNAPDTRDLRTGVVVVAASDGDGGMLGRVLVYASIMVVATVMFIWRRNG